jgi:DNA-binding transcriptional LysR family regulator
MTEATVRTIVRAVGLTAFAGLLGTGKLWTLFPIAHPLVELSTLRVLAFVLLGMGLVCGYLEKRFDEAERRGVKLSVRGTRSTGERVADVAAAALVLAGMALLWTASVAWNKGMNGDWVRERPTATEAIWYPLVGICLICAAGVLASFKGSERS